MFIKTIFKEITKVKRCRNYVLKSYLYLYFLIWQKLLISGEKILMSAELGAKGVRQIIRIFFGFSLGKA